MSAQFYAWRKRALRQREKLTKAMKDLHEGGLISDAVLEATQKRANSWYETELAEIRRQHGEHGYRDGRPPRGGGHDVCQFAHGCTRPTAKNRKYCSRDHAPYGYYGLDATGCELPGPAVAPEDLA